MSASRKPQAGEPMALSASALADAYRAADIVLGKDGGFTGLTDQSKLDCITVKARGDDYRVGNAITFSGQWWGGGTYSQGSQVVETENELIRCESSKRHQHTNTNVDDYYNGGINFGIVRNLTTKGVWQILKVQVRGLITCRCLLFAEAKAVTVPLQTDDEIYRQYRYPVGNYYGPCPIISTGRYYKIGEYEYPRIQECLINLG